MLAAADRGRNTASRHVPIVVAHERLRWNAVKPTTLAHEHDPVAIGVEVVLGLTGTAPWHEQKPMVLLVHLSSVPKASTPVAHAVVLHRLGHTELTLLTIV